MEPGTSPSPTKTKLIPGQILGGVVGVAVGSYVGMNLLVPAVAYLVIWYVGAKLLRPASPLYLPACAVQGAHLVWLVVGMAILASWGANLIDVIVLGFGVVWLWLAPSVWPVIMLSLFQLFALYINVTLMVQQSLAATEHRALALHVAMRVAALWLMWSAYARTRRRHSEA